jgi:uncharacterized Tic20 family protein
VWNYSIKSSLFVSITGRRQIHFQIEAVIFVLIVFVIEFTALLCRRERFPPIIRTLSALDVPTWQF